MELPSMSTRGSLRIVLLFCSLAAICSASEAKDSKKGAGLSADIARPYQQVVPVVQEIAQDGFIRGTYEYRGMDQLDGATLSKEAKAFGAWKGPGIAFYKVRTSTIAPAHFDDSQDIGTVTVRYLVEPVTSNSSRITIDAVFEENSHRRSHASEGIVESSEFVAISEKFRRMDEAEKQREEQAEQLLRHKQLQDLQESERREQEGVDAVDQEIGGLEQKIAELQKGRLYRVRTTTDLKVSPFSKAQALRSLKVGDGVLILLETPNWCQVQAGDGTQGWVYRFMLEADQ
jgi:hypothetical protein